MCDLSARYNLPPRTPLHHSVLRKVDVRLSGIVAPADGYMQMKIYLLIHR